MIWRSLLRPTTPIGSILVGRSSSRAVTGPEQLYRSEITVTAASVTAANTYIGNSVHADIHTIVFTPGSASQMWVGCDGGVYRTNNATGTGDIFTSLNKGLQTLTLNYLGQHPTEDAVIFSGSQDNGGERFTGEEAWLYTSGGDSGYFVVNWNDPYRVADTYVRGAVRRSTTGGTRYSYSDVPVPLVGGDNALFYAPLVGTPINPGAPGESEILAFGSVRPWISTNFGTSWQSIPNNTLAGDQLNGSIKCLSFASATKLYAGTMSGGVYRFDKSGAIGRAPSSIRWVAQTPFRWRVSLRRSPSTSRMEPAIRSILLSAAMATTAMSGISTVRNGNNAAGRRRAPQTRFSMYNTTPSWSIPRTQSHVYAGADIGIWRSTNGGTAWQVFSDGLAGCCRFGFQAAQSPPASAGKYPWPWRLRAHARYSAETGC